MREQIEQLAARETASYSDEDFALFAEFKEALNRGEIRAAERDSDGNWHTNAWVKRGILLGFRMGAIVDMSPAHRGLHCPEKDTSPIHHFTPTARVRVV